MLDGALVFAVLGVAFWVLLALDRRRAFPRLHRLPMSGSEAKGKRDEVAVVIPARNEASTLERSLSRLAAQSVPVSRIVVVDDRSSDATVDVARRFARRTGTAIDIVRIDALPEGWTGKVYALDRGVRTLDGTWRVAGEHRWVLFTDADIEHPEDSVMRLLAQAHAGPCDLVSVMARLRTVTLWEKLLIPAFVWFFQLLYPFRRVSDPQARVAAAAGGCVLLRVETLETAGGPAAMRAAIIDDLALARLVKNSGGRLWLGLSQDVISTRPYPSLRSLVDMVARSAFAELEYRYWRVPLVWLLLLFFFVLPPFLGVLGVATGTVPLAACGLGAWALCALQVLPAFRHHRVPATYAWLMPLAAALYAWMTSVSAWRHARGRSTPWRSPEPTSRA